MSGQTLPVAIIGAGPTGLAAAAHLVERGEIPVIFEMSEGVAGNIETWHHVRAFSRWADNIDPASRRLLEAQGWEAPDDDLLPTGRELIDLYLDPLAQTAAIRQHLHLGVRVTAVGRANFDKMKAVGRENVPFTIQTIDAKGAESRFEARAVIDASGTWANPNPIGAGGLPAVGERMAADHIFYGIPDLLGTHRDRYTDRRVMVVGSGHSAFQALLDLAKLRKAHPGTTIHWVMRRKPGAATFGGGENDELPARGRLGQKLMGLIATGGINVLAPFGIEEVKDTGISLAVTSRDEGGASHTVEVDEIVAVTGSRPDLEMLREVVLDIDPAIEGVASIAPLIDPNFHSCGTVPPHGEEALRQPEKDFYIVGHKSYGRAPTFLMMTGYEQVRSVVAALTGDIEASRRLELVLPDTGVDFLRDDAVYDLEVAVQA